VSDASVNGPDELLSAKYHAMMRAYAKLKTTEGFWSILKRGIVGSFDKISKKYLHLYVAEIQFRYTNRENADIFETAIREC